MLSLRLPIALDTIGNIIDSIDNSRNSLQELLPRISRLEFWETPRISRAIDTTADCYNNKPATLAQSVDGSQGYIAEYTELKSKVSMLQSIYLIISQLLAIVSISSITSIALARISGAINANGDSYRLSRSSRLSMLSAIAIIDSIENLDENMLLTRRYWDSWLGVLVSGSNWGLFRNRVWGGSRAQFLLPFSPQYCPWLPLPAPSRPHVCVCVCVFF